MTGTNGTATRAANHALDAFDLQRLGLLLLACAELSKDKYVLLRYSPSQGLWRVNVRIAGQEHTASSQTSPLLAMDRACQWLRTVTARHDGL